MSKIPRTVCPFCNLGCELGFEIKAGDVRRVEYVSDSRNQARLCPKGNASAQIVNHQG
jgi:anaerobic selenocysteine-containing dehydrogenase